MIQITMIANTITVAASRMTVRCSSQKSNSTRSDKMNSFKTAFNNKEKKDTRKRVRKQGVDDVLANIGKLMKSEVTEARDIFSDQRKFIQDEIEEFKQMKDEKEKNRRNSRRTDKFEELDDDDEDYFEAEIVSA